MMTKIVVLYVLLASPMVFVWEWRASETRLFCIIHVSRSSFHIGTIGLLGAQSAETETDTRNPG